MIPLTKILGLRYLIFDEHGIRLKERRCPGGFAVPWSEIRTVRVRHGTLSLTLKRVDPDWPIPGLYSRNEPPCFDSWAGGIMFCRLDRFVGASSPAVEDALDTYAGKTWADQDRRRARPSSE